TARKDLVNFSHHEIITFYNHRIQGLISFYSFASNLTSLRIIIMFLHLSCALTLALKYKLRTSKKVFEKYGRKLADPETDVALKIHKSLKVKHSFTGKVSTTEPENILKISSFNNLIKSSLNKTFIICESTNDIEMHHHRQVKDDKAKIRTGNSS